MTRRRPPGLSAEDEALWHQIADTVHPLRRGSKRQRAEVDNAAAEPAPAPPAPLATPAMPRPAPRWQPLVTTPPPRPAPLPTPPTPILDRRQTRKIARGHVAIDGRIDLHGLTESEAHVRLRGYLRQAQAQGKRIILVITGKGRESDDPGAPWDFGAGPARRGVLKRNVPRWLGEPDMRDLVVSFTTAHIRHGGEGALYVHIRQAR